MSTTEDAPETLAESGARLSPVASDVPTQPAQARARPRWGLAFPSQILALNLVGQMLMGSALILIGRRLGSIASAHGADAAGDSWTIFAALALTDGLLVAFVAVVARRRFGAEWRDLAGIRAIARRASIEAVAVGVLLFLFNLGFSALIDIGLEDTEIFNSVHGLSDLLVASLAVVILAPIFEELLFRGLFFHALETLGSRRAIVVSALLFAAVHFLPYAKAPLAILPVFAVGLANGLLRDRSGSIVPGILSHAVFNALGVVTWAIQIAHGS